MRNVPSIIVFGGVLLLVGTAWAQATGTKPVTAAPPPAKPALRRELLAMAERDQAIRKEWIAKGVEHPDASIGARMNAIDTANTARVKAIVRRYGWPGATLVGLDGSEAAFLLVQHADYATQKQMLPLVKKAYQEGSMPGQDYALLLDRVLMREGKPQVYGTQARQFSEWKGHEPVLMPIEDEANVDKRRASVGLFPLAQYKKMLKEAYFPQDKTTAP